MIRRLLREKLFDAWQETISQDYANRRINSERSLQASYWASINKRLNNKTWRLFIEPDFRLSDKRRKHIIKPDILIANSKELICVIELKYQPNVKPSVAKDVESLQWIVENSDRLCYSNSRFRGENKAIRNYCFSDSTLYVWAGVHSAEATNGSLMNCPCFMDGFNSLENQYLELHAETKHNKPPIVYKKAY